MRAVWTDLAMEARGALPCETASLGDGIERTIVRILDEETARRMKRPCGAYVTLSCPQHTHAHSSAARTLSREMAKSLSQMLPEGARSVLVTGLGNRHVTPDALGPRVVERIFVTRHMESLLSGRGDVCSVSAIAPGVLGVTGIETAEVLRGMVQRIRPDAVIAVDALAARDSSRICTTVQLADSGIAPGSGVGNHRRALTRETLGVPVIAVGVPMVVYASTIAADAMAAFARMDGAQEEDEERLCACVRRVVCEQMGELIVTPREVDALVERMAGILADGINRALHPALSAGELAQLTAT